MRIQTETVVGLFMMAAIAVFIFMSFKVGICRLDSIRYAHYSNYFKDISGLHEKADVCISGVKVGWIEKIHLINRDAYVRVDMMIDRNSILYSDAFATIRQDGLLGTKYIEITQGDSMNPILPPGSTLIFTNKSPVAIDEILSSFKEIADNVQEVTNSLKIIMANENNMHSVSQLVCEAQNAFQSINTIATQTNTLIEKNDTALTNLIHNFSATVTEVRETLPSLITTVKSGLESATTSLSKAGKSFAKMTIPAKNIMKKLNSSDGILGSLITDEMLSKDFKNTMTTVKKYFSYSDQIMLNIDTHLESMQAPGNDLDFKDSKGYFNFVIRTSDDTSYIIGLTSSYAGEVKRTRTDTMYLDDQKHQMVNDLITMPNWARIQFAPVVDQYVRNYSSLLYNVQFAKEIGRFNIRAGVFENTFGFGIDYDVPLLSDVKWISTFELYRFNEFMPQTISGRLVFDIDLPHLKWFNRVFVNDSCYFVFGADDFISKFNKNFFVGMGVSFEQNDLKYLISKIK